MSFFEEGKRVKEKGKRYINKELFKSLLFIFLPLSPFPFSLSPSSTMPYAQLTNMLYV
jgi:hypothetical protein